MNAVTLNDAKQNLERVIDRVIADAEPTIVGTESGQQMVVIALDEYNSWKETLYLLASPTNAERLRRSIAEAKAGQTHERGILSKIAGLGWIESSVARLLGDALGK